MDILNHLQLSILILNMDSEERNPTAFKDIIPVDLEHDSEATADTGFCVISWTSKIPRSLLPNCRYLIHDSLRILMHHDV